MKVYCASIISGRSGEDVFKYYTEVTRALHKMGYTVLHPMVCKDYMSNYLNIQSEGQAGPLSSDHTIKERDKWMVQMADVIYVDLIHADRVSIGCIAELAWGDLLGKHTVVLMEKSNPNRHAFTNEMADVIFETRLAGLKYMENLIQRHL